VIKAIVLTLFRYCLQFRSSPILKPIKKLSKMKRLLLFAILAIAAECGMGQNVGIGTTRPSEKLDVNGNLRTDTVKTNGLRIIPNGGEGKVLTSDDNGNASWRTNSNGAAAGNIGFGVWGDCATNGNISEYQPAGDTAKGSNNYGRSVAISGNFAVIGSDGDLVGGNSNQGSASVYEFDGEKWVLRQKLTDPAGNSGDNFGKTVAISGNYLVIGSPGDDVGANSNQGSACVFRYTGTDWVFLQKLTDATGGATNNFGSSVSISGNFLIAGSPNDNIALNLDQGSISIFQFNGSSWVLKQKISDATGATDDNFGYSVAISGGKIIVGAPFDDYSVYTNMGSISFYEYNGSSWVLQEKIQYGLAESRFGNNVSISGNYAIAGAPSYVVLGKSAGVAAIYFYNGTDWVQQDVVSAADGENDDNFGSDVSINGNYAIVGAYYDNVGGNILQGSCTIFSRVGNAWRRLQPVKVPNGEAGDSFGYSISLDQTSKRFIISAPQHLSSARGLVFFGKIN
jgi:hypothetical protein